MNIVVFTQGLSPIVESILETYGLQAVVESGPRGSVATTGNTKLQAFCAERNIPYFWLTKPTRPALIPFLTSLPPPPPSTSTSLPPPPPLFSTSSSPLDLAAVYSMSQLLPAAVLDLFQRGVINAHPSQLPAYRGPNPYFWTFYDGCRETALTIHYLDAGEDTGDIILYRPIFLNALRDKGYGVDLKGEVKRLLAPLMLDALHMIDAGTVRRIPQSAASPTVRARNVTPDNVLEILAKLDLPLDAAAVFFENTLDALPLRQFGFRRPSGDWRVWKTVPATLAVPSSDVDRIRLTRHGFALPRPDGWVVLKPRLPIVKFAAKLLRDAFRAFRARKTNRPKIAYYELEPSRCSAYDGNIDVRMVTDVNMRDVVDWRGASTVQTFEGFLKQGYVGVYAYKNGKVVGHAWLWRAGEKKRRLFGWLAVPDGWDFVHYCRAAEDPDYANTIHAMLAALCSANLKGEKLGISVPENDKILTTAIKALSQSLEKSKLRVEVEERSDRHSSTSTSNFTPPSIS